jgi:FkbM family methyltransferase
MIDRNDLLARLSKLESIARASKTRRLFYTPFKYIFAVVIRNIVYPFTRKESEWRTRLFWGDKITVVLPASIDIFLLGCKTDPSEIRLTRFLLENLREGNFFVDIGSHIGYYSLLASFCTGEKGKVVSIEASSSSFHTFKKNSLKHPNIEAFNIALSDKEEMIEFFEFRGPFTEYNTMEPGQFKGQKWFDAGSYNKIPVSAMCGDKLLEKYRESVTIIKIDVEGAENRVIKGLKNYLDRPTLLVVMEFLNTKRNNASHREADAILKSMGYSAFRIGNKGELIHLKEPTEEYVDNSGVESDNIVYSKQNA